MFVLYSPLQFQDILDMNGALAENVFIYMEEYLPGDNDVNVVVYIANSSRTVIDDLQLVTKTFEQIANTSEHLNANTSVTVRSSGIAFFVLQDLMYDFSSVLILVSIIPFDLAVKSNWGKWNDVCSLQTHWSNRGGPSCGKTDPPPPI